MLYRKSLTSFGSTSFENFTPTLGGHSYEETMGSFPFDVAWLKSSFHKLNPFLSSKNIPSSLGKPAACIENSSVMSRINISRTPPYINQMSLMNFPNLVSFRLYTFCKLYCPQELASLLPEYRATLQLFPTGQLHPLIQ